MVKVANRKISGEVVQTVNARDLHAWLEVGKDFSNWAKQQIERARLVEGRDYNKLAQKGELSATGQTRIEYYFTIDSAKHVAMMSQTDKGFEVREYFIVIEKQFRVKQSAEWQRAREEGKLSRKAETDVIQQFVEYATAQGSKSAQFYYANITKGTYKALYVLEQGADMKRLRERLSVMQLNQLATAEGVARKAIAEYMEMGTHYKDIYKLAIDRVCVLADLLGHQLPGDDNVRRLG